MAMAMVSEMARTRQRTEPHVERKISTARPPPIELQTENGFSIIRRCDLDGHSSMGGTEHCFVVRDPDGYELDITVNFSNSAIAEVIHHSGGRVTLESSCWLASAEHHLSDYLWEHEDYPPDARITIDYVTPHDIDLARRWGTDIPPHEQPKAELLRPTVTFGDGDGARAKPQPIKFLTENDFSVVRLCDLDSSISDSTEECHFRVTNPKGWEREIRVRFGRALVQDIQSRRRRGELAAASKYWLTIAEKYLGDYLWQNDAFPPDCRHTIDQLAGDDLLLGAHWIDDDRKD